MSENIIYGKEVAIKIKEDLKNEIFGFKEQNKRQPALAVVLVGEDPASKIYVNNKNKTCVELGIDSHMHILDENVSKDELVALIDKLNADDNIDGILVQLPLPKHIPEEEIINRIDPLKDVDCFHPENIGLMFAGSSRFLPCTPAGIMEMLKFKNIDLTGKNAVIVGRSNIVGKPAAILLLEKHATVTITHSRTKDIKSVIKQADVIIAAVGIKHFVTADMVKEGAIVIDVGINRVDGKLYGDVDFDNIKDKASYITPVPGGVGVMTIAMLMKNTIRAYKLR